jgi:hypothetical protein
MNDLSPLVLPNGIRSGEDAKPAEQRQKIDHPQCLFPIFTPHYSVKEVCNKVDIDSLSVVLDYAWPTCDTCESKKDVSKSEFCVKLIQGKYTRMFCNMQCFRTWYEEEEFLSCGQCGDPRVGVCSRCDAVKCKCGSEMVCQSCLGGELECDCGEVLVCPNCDN